ncbi:MAG: inositol monophosphatase family protein [Betaproteobacteria bacterium]
MTRADAGTLRAFAVELSRSATATIAHACAKPAESTTKVDAGDWVTPFDRAVDADVRARIAARYPTHAVVGEELGRGDGAVDAELTWQVDPIDGTLNFVHGLPWVAFSAAVSDAQGVVAGVVADAFRGIVYSAQRGGGAFVDEVAVRCASVDRIAGGVFLTEWSRQAPWRDMHRYLDRIADHAAGTRIMGSSALALALVGAGRASGAILGGHYNRWDVDAGALIAREAGASIYGRTGPHAGVPMDGILAAPSGVADALWRAWTAGEP